MPFQVWYASNNTATGEYNDLGVFYTDEEGRIVLSDPDLSLRDGWFRVKELEPAPGFALADPDTQEAFIAAGEGHTFRFLNRPLSAISVWKYDSETGAAIEGAVFQVRVLAGPGLKPGGQRVAQAGGKEPPGGVGDDAGIDLCFFIAPSETLCF